MQPWVLLGMAKRSNLLRRSGVLRSASKSRNYAISGGRSHRAEQGFAAPARPRGGGGRTKLIRAAARPPPYGATATVATARWVERGSPRYTFPYEPAPLSLPRFR